MTHDPLTWDNLFGSDPYFQKAQNDDELGPPQFAAGYAAALRDAVEALSPLIPDRGGDTDFGKGIAEGVVCAVRVIEALVSTPDVIESGKEQHPHG